MGWKILRGCLIFIVILLGFGFLLLLPREIKITQVSLSSFIADYPFSIELIKKNIHSFIDYIYANNGLGNIKTGMKVTEETTLLFTRSLTIILPCFITSILAGILVGAAQFQFQEKAVGKIFSFFNWLSSSIPDFFLYIAFQYLLIKLMKIGLPNFNLYGNDNWYSFLLPSIALTIFPMFHIAKFLYVSLQHESRQDYIKTSKAKGMTESQVLLHMLRNCTAALLHQTQIVMLYILTSLPIIEKLSNFHGAGDQLLESILQNEDNRALGLIIPFLFLMLLINTIAQIVKTRLVPVKVGKT
jgi:oligopeptide transport system permease protein